MLAQLFNPTETKKNPIPDIGDLHHLLPATPSSFGRG
jgi:hypothetical protein